MSTAPTECPECGADLKRFVECGEVVLECKRDEWCWTAYEHEVSDKPHPALGGDDQ